MHVHIDVNVMNGENRKMGEKHRGEQTFFLFFHKSSKHFLDSRQIIIITFYVTITVLFH